MQKVHTSPLLKPLLKSEEEIRSKGEGKISSNPKLNFSQCFKVSASMLEEFIDHIQTQAIEIDVLGKHFSYTSELEECVRETLGRLEPGDRKRMELEIKKTLEKRGDEFIQSRACALQ